jgi:hypothetical protein
MRDDRLGEGDVISQALRLTGREPFSRLALLVRRQLRFAAELVHHYRARMP